MRSGKDRRPAARKVAKKRMKTLSGGGPPDAGSLVITLSDPVAGLPPIDLPVEYVEDP